MADLNENHKRHLLTTFRYLDELLDEAEHMMASARSRSAFPRYVPDATPVQRKLLGDHFVRFRETLLATLPELGIEPRGPTISLLRALRVQVMSADIALEDTGASSMRGYGALSPEAAAAITRVIVELQGQLERMSAFLDEAPDRNLQARLERLAATNDEVALLRELERLITAHGLVELRPALAVLVERMERRRFEVAVFGRVSSGKSSLLNYFLRRDVLPTGVTPITAIPTQIAFGEVERVIVDFAEQKSRVIALAALAEVATEQQNPGNRKHVTHIGVELPESRLASGVSFVDTPGLGSLATSGAEETLAYLPRCDLGIVLVDAASTLSPQDSSVVRALYQSGAMAAVLLSKADLLTPAQRDEVAEYAKKALAAECGVDVPVAPVSVLGSSRTLADEWFEKHLLPLCQRQEEMAAIGLRRKVGALRDAVVATLRYRLERQHAESPQASAGGTGGATQALAQAATLFGPTGERCEELASRLERATAPVIETAAAAIAERWRGGKDRTQVAREALADALSDQAGRVAGEVVAELTQLREQLSGALSAAAAGSSAREEPGLPRVAGLPVVDGSALTGQLVLKGSLLAVFGRFAIRRAIAAQLRAQLAPALRDVLVFHRRRLTAWIHTVVAEQRRAFSVEAEALRPRLVGRELPSGAGSGEDRAAMEKDLRSVEAWGRGDARLSKNEASH